MAGWRVAAALVALATASEARGWCAPAQVQAAVLTVRVEDETGGVIRGAEVTVAPVNAEGAARRLVAVARTDARGNARVADLAPGRYTVEVSASGFESQRIEVGLAPGEARDVRVRLRIAPRRETVVVSGGGARARPGMPRILTAEDIAALPDDPEGLERVLRHMAGPGATIVVDGFRAAALPHKLEIAFIEFRWSELSAERHEAGEVTIEITTRPGTDTLWGAVDATFTPQALAAREKYAQGPGRTESTRYFGGIGGPVWHKRSSVSLYAGGSGSRQPLPFTGTTPAEPPPPRDIVSSDWFAQLRSTYRLTASTLLRHSSNLQATAQAHARASPLDLPERAYDTDSTFVAHRVGVLWGRRSTLVNEVRGTFESRTGRWRPQTAAPAVQVAGAFWTGGAQREGSRRTTTWSLADDLSGQAGRHAWRAGGLLEAEAIRDEVAVNRRGTFLFSTVADYLAGRPSRFSQRLGDPSVQSSTRRVGLFVQDDVAIRSNLELGMGVRWEQERGPSRLRGWAPRVRVNWRVRGTTVSGGGGIYHDWVGLDVFQHAARLDGGRQQDRLVFDPGYPDPGDGEAVVVLPPSVVRLAPDLRLTRMVRLVAGVDRPLGQGGVLRVRFQENRSANALRGRNVNAPDTAGTRPDPRFGVVTLVEPAGFRRTRSLRVSFDRSTQRPRSFLSLIYVLGSVVNETDGPFALPSDSRNPAVDRGPSASDIRHAMGASLVQGLSASWSVVTTVAARSPQPYTLTTGRDDNGDGVLNDRPPGVGRNSVRGAWHVTVSGQLVWTRALSRGSDAGQGGTSSPGSRRRVTARLEVENLFNRTNPTSYVGVLTSPLVGQPIAAAPPRRVGVTMSVGF